MKNSVCPICGQPTSSYMGHERKDGLCRKHANELKAGKIELRPYDVGFLLYDLFYDTKTNLILNKDKNDIPEELRSQWLYGKINSATLWDDVEENASKDIITPPPARTVCVVCGEPTKNGHLQCKDCYYETLDYMDGLNKNSRMNEFRDYYYNLKDVIFRMKNFDSVKSNCNKLIAIALQNQQTNSDSSLTDKMEADVTRLIDSKKPKENAPEIPLAVTEKDEQKSNIYPTIDGHMVKSSMEQAIDDILWNAGILHAYEQPITEFVYERKKCDWFIPIIGSEQGIYIEYWGMKTQKYLEDRKEKEDLYKKYNVPYIGIEKDDPKDTHSFRSILLQELQRKAIEYYGFMPKWKK